MKIKIIGAGLAGCEAAYQLAEHGFEVELYECKTITKNPIQKLDAFAELVCSNTLRSKSLKNAVGILKAEMQMFNSLIIQAAYATCIPSDDALAVDREQFANYITTQIQNHPKINIINKEVDFVDDVHDLTLITTGPLTSEAMKKEIERLIGKQKLFYLDASAPIIEKNSIDFSQVYKASRHNQKQGDYICLPLNETEFNHFVEALQNAETVQTKEFEKEIYFKGCQPIEVMAKESKKILLNGPMSPNHLIKPDGSTPYAVVQLRQDDAIDSLYNFVGFQTNLKWPEQQRVLSTLPGLANLKIVRYGVMHKNYYINSPKILNNKLQVMRRKNVFFAGQITGVEGYVESSVSGIIASLGIIASVMHQKLPKMSSSTVMGALHNYVTNEKIKQLKPMKANLGIMKKDFNEALGESYYSKSQDEMKKYLNSIKNIIEFKIK
ncbi:methylenetetrahydrofolate--tRNA-(uracil(54)-C(5))-methyltransferase (FADH(2)-oxidizing) TrmFO [Williamsoniiplasma lucivorax]|uniref:Methylenetetrahydrofolate--tRNA-(uracil-5-)-methyltransferase TrmFO n=1 Tax=Williamsoniiplasma lucivorax TaxID=209274 RepID=A0A2S5RDJ0_9MOLU|nr:methylenetetrahydrofolate--tRNA-(uracil(54)-C(5))-methyltransferase (FADH(2)-oxidizing) TrmFO [Williamsoniiplasma lucivorax]PPE05380.1 tRNA (uracil-5-)-methyltransferase Gid [Williamsoniiplasma lucivorax]